MRILKRVLYLDALLSAVGGLLAATVPRFFFVTVLDQPPPLDDALLRLLGVASFVLALYMVLVAHRIEEVWWWSWGFVVLEGGAALIFTFHALLGLPSGAAAWSWWLLAGLSWALAFGLLWGLARAGIEKPPF